MKPIKFLGYTNIIGGEPDTQELPVFADTEAKKIVCCFQLDEADLALINKDKKVWLSFHSLAIIPFDISVKPLIKLNNEN